MDPNKLNAMLVMCVGIPSLVGLCAYLIKKWFGGHTCYKCFVRMTPFDKLPPADQDALMAYFKAVDHRNPNPDKICACQSCGQVTDDFSSASFRFDGDDIQRCKICDSRQVSFLADFCGRAIGYVDKIEGFQEAHPSLLNRTECLACNRGVDNSSSCPSCDATVRVLGCARCLTLYCKTPVAGSKLFVTLPVLAERQTVSTTNRSKILAVLPTPTSGSVPNQKP